MSPGETFVAGLALTPVKGMQVREVEQIELGDLAAVGDRAFYVIDDRGRMVNGKQLGELQSVCSDYDAIAGELTLTFADGTTVRDRIAHGETVTTRFFSRPRAARLLAGPWAQALSSQLGRTLRLVEPEFAAVDRGRRGAVSVISRASLGRLAEVAGVAGVDARRFRMLIEVDGVAAHEEDGWIGRRVRIGSALLAMRGHIGRCLVTSRDPQTGEIDLPTLDLLRDYRQALESTEPLPFGIHGEVLRPGSVRRGDLVELQAEPARPAGRSPAGRAG